VWRPVRHTFEVGQRQDTADLVVRELGAERALGLDPDDRVVVERVRMCAPRRRLTTAPRALKRSWDGTADHYRRIGSVGRGRELALVEPAQVSSRKRREGKHGAFQARGLSVEGVDLLWHSETESAAM
jgi:hypothetical protein